MTRALRWCTLAGITAGLLGLTVQASAATGFTQVTPSGLPAGAQDSLNGSFALSDTDAWAVGAAENVSADTVAPLALNWNGTAWSVVSGPNEGILQAVLDFSPTNAYAFADFSVLHWNGTAWSVVSGAVPALRVSADGPDDIWGVSRDDMVTHYNGTTWTSTTLSAGTPDLESVVALSPTDVWVSGATTTGTIGGILEHFNGTSWQNMTLPSSFASDGLNAVTAQSSSDVWVFSNTGSPGVPLLLANWNGSSWTTYPSPLPADTLETIGSAASSPSHVWLFVTNDSDLQPLILSDSS